MRAIDEASTIVRRAIEARGSKQVHAIIAPAEATREVGDGHDLDHGDPDLRQFRQFAAGSLPRPPGCEGPECIS